jgi:hypothetical protein
METAEYASACRKVESLLLLDQFRCSKTMGICEVYVSPSLNHRFIFSSILPFTLKRRREQRMMSFDCGWVMVIGYEKLDSIICSF